MEQLLSRPEMQSAVVPFVIALVVYLGLRKLTTTAWLWAMFAAFVASALLINGFTLTPLTGTRKIILLISGALFAAALLPRVLAHLHIQAKTNPVKTLRISGTDPVVVKSLLVGETT